MMNARLKNVFSLSSKVTVYVPATVDIDKEIDNKKFVDRAATRRYIYAFSMFCVLCRI